jgi:hypothetical protein
VKAQMPNVGIGRLVRDQQIKQKSQSFPPDSGLYLKRNEDQKYK